MFLLFCNNYCQALKSSSGKRGEVDFAVNRNFIHQFIFSLLYSINLLEWSTVLCNLLKEFLFQPRFPTLFLDAKRQKLPRPDRNYAILSVAHNIDIRSATRFHLQSQYRKIFGTPNQPYRKDTLALTEEGKEDRMNHKVGITQSSRSQ